MQQAIDIAGQSGATSVAHALATVSTAVRRPVILTSAWPPGEGDIDLLCRADERRALRAALSAAGFMPRGHVPPARAHTEQWVRFAAGHACLIDLNPVERYGLPDEEVEALFADAGPGPVERVATPAAHHRLLLAARRLGRNELGPRQWRRVEAALAVPGALETATRHAAAWGAARGLHAVCRVNAGGSGPSKTDRLAIVAEGLAARRGRSAVVKSVAVAARNALPTRTRVIAFSGLDGSGKSTQVEALQRVLSDAGVDAVVCWRPLGHSRAIRTLRRTAKRALRTGGAAAAPSASADAPARSWDPNPVTRRLRERSALATQLWAAYVAITTAGGHRGMALRHAARGRVLIFDRHALDTCAQLEHFYGPAGWIRSRIVRTLTPAADVAFFLDVPSAVAHDRKALQYTREELDRMADCYRRHVSALGVTRLDGTRPAEALCDEIATTSWRALAG